MARIPTLRPKILHSAAILAAQNGISATTVDEIATHAGIAKGSIYNNFSSKEAIFEALLEESFARLIETVTQVADSPSPTPKACQEAILNLLAHEQASAKVAVAEFFRTDRAWKHRLQTQRRQLCLAVARSINPQHPTQKKTQNEAISLLGATFMHALFNAIDGTA